MGDNKPSFIQVNKNGGESVNPGLLADYFRINNDYLIAKDLNTGAVIIYLYNADKGIYIKQTENDLQNIIKTPIYNYNPAFVDMNKIKSVVKDLQTDNSIPLDSLDSDESIIVFENGVLNIDTMQLSEHSHYYKSTIQIPCKWQGKSAPTPYFDSYIENLTNGDKGLQNLLLQYIGAVISNTKGYRYKQALLIYGAGNTGKTVFLELLCRLVGRSNYASIPLDKINARFQTSALYGKRLIGEPDMKYVKIESLDTFKNLTGGDTVQVEFKNQPLFSYRYNGFMLFCANRLPKFGGDKGSQVYDRFVVMECNNIIPEEKRNKKLLDCLYEEREGIVYKAVTAFRATITEGYNFTIPEHCRKQTAKFKRENSLAITFVEECCLMWNQADVKPEDKQNLCSKIHRVFNQWCKDNNRRNEYSPQDFRKEIADYYNREKVKFRKTAGEYYIFRLRDEVAKQYQYDFDYSLLIYGDTAGAETTPERVTPTPADNNGFDWEDVF